MGWAWDSRKESNGLNWKGFKQEEQGHQTDTFLFLVSENNGVLPLSKANPSSHALVLPNPASLGTTPVSVPCLLYDLVSSAALWQQHGGWAESTPWVSKTKAHTLQVIPRPVSFSPLQLGTILYPLFLSWPFGPWTYLAFPSIKIIALKLRCFFFSQALSLAPLILSKHNPVQKHLWLKYVSYTVSLHLMLSIGSVTISKTACDETSFTTDQLIQERVKFLNISSTIT